MLTRTSRLVLDSDVLIRTALQKQEDLRTAHKALLAVARANASSNKTHDVLFRACEDYWQKFRRKAFCFEDIRDALSALGQRSKENFIDQLSLEESEGATSGSTDSSNTMRALNVLKLRYCFSLPVGVPRRQLEGFVCDALEVYRTSLDSSSRCPEAALLAAMALVRLAFAGLAETKSASRYDPHLLQAVFVLENCRTRIQDYYPYSLLLLQIKSLLGLMSLTMKDFKGLNIKNVQWETTGHVLLTRISTTHPRSAGNTTPSEEASLEPLHALRAALFMSESAGESLSTQIRSGLKNGSYVNVIESIDMRSDLEHSLSRHLVIQEEARIKQLLSVPDVDDVPLRPSRLVDNRDFSYLPSYEAEASPAFEEYLRSGPLPGERWLAAITLYNQTVRFLKGELYGHRAPSTTEIELFQTALAASSDMNITELTDVELDNLQAHASLANAAVAMKYPSGQESTSLAQHIADIESWLRGKTSSSKASNEAAEGSKTERHVLQFGSSTRLLAPSWTYLHHAFSILETLQGISLLLAVLYPKPKTKSASPKVQAGLIDKEKISEMQKLVQEVEAAVHESARKLKRELNESGMLGTLMDIGLGRKEQPDEQSMVGKALEELADATGLEMLCGDMKESWEDALDGILAIKVKAK